MLYQAKTNGDIGVKGCKIVGNGDIFGYKLINIFFVDNSGFGSESEPALTFDNFLSKIKAGYFYGIREVGQFQVYIGEYIKVKRQKVFDDLGILSSKKVANNTRLTIFKNGDKTLTLHNTNIIKWQGDKIILNSGGWRTVTTKSRINEFLPDIFISQKDFKWIINYKGKNLDFFDGITLKI